MEDNNNELEGDGLADENSDEFSAQNTSLPGTLTCTIFLRVISLF